MTIKIGNEDYDQRALVNKLYELENKAEKNCKKCLNMLEYSFKLDPDAQFKDTEGYIQSISSIKSKCYFNLGNIYFKRENYEKAIEYYQLSYDSDLNQESIFNVYAAIANLPVEGGGLFGGKKKEAAKEAKREQEISLLMKVIKFAPFSHIGIESAQILMEKYGVMSFDI